MMKMRSNNKKMVWKDKRITLLRDKDRMKRKETIINIEKINKQITI